MMGAGHAPCPKRPTHSTFRLYAAQKVFPVAEWRRLFGDGTVTKWLQQVTDFFATTGNIPNPVPASQYFDPSIYLDATKA